jgi:hypothetical protein
LPPFIPFFPLLTTAKFQAKCQKVVPNPSKDAELEASLAGAQEVFAHISDASWLSWGATLLPHLVKEAEERAKHAREEEELARITKERAELEERAAARRARLEAGMQKWMDDAISKEQWEILEAEIKAEGLADGEIAEVRVTATKMDIEAGSVGGLDNDETFSFKDILDDLPQHPSPSMVDERSSSPLFLRLPPATRPTRSSQKKPVLDQKEEPSLLTKSEGKRKREDTPEDIVEVLPPAVETTKSRRTKPLAMMKATGRPPPEVKTKTVVLRKVEGKVSPFISLATPFSNPLFSV